MAVNLQVTLTLEDRLSSQINRANQRIQQTQQQVRTLDQRLSSTRASLNSARSSISNFGSSGTKAVSLINGKFLGLIATIGATHLAMSGLSSIITKSAEFERSQVTIGAIFDDKQATDAYLEMVKKVAVDSPILDSSAMFSNSLPFLTLSKDVGLLEDAWKVAEKLSIINPMQGVEGSVIAMKELASGDVVSLAERFNIGKKDLNKLKELSFKDQVSGLNNLISGMGITDKAVVEMGNTTAAQFVKVKEKWDVMLTEMGESSNTHIGNALRKFNEMLDEGKFDKIAQAMDKTLGTIASKITKFVETADWDAISEKAIAAFDKINDGISWMVDNWDTISATITSVFTGVVSVLAWVREHWELVKNSVIVATAAFVAFKVVSTIITVIEAIITVVNWAVKVFKLLKNVMSIVRVVFTVLRVVMLAFPGTWVVAAISLVISAFVLLWQKCEAFRDFWGSMWDGIVVGFEWTINNLVDGINYLISAINKIPFVDIGAIDGFDVNGDHKQTGANQTTTDAKKKQVNVNTSKPRTISGPTNQLVPLSAVKTNSHSGGLSRVPYDGYQATLHRNERVLTNVEADSYERGSVGNSSVTVNFAGANFNVRNESDIEAIANALATKINQSIIKGA